MEDCHICNECLVFKNTCHFPENAFWFALQENIVVF